MHHPRNSRLLPHARTLRREMTREERHLWYDFLRGYHPRFRRQEIIGSYIADFYCSSAKLVVELDGSQHFEDAGLQYDEQRTLYFQSLGICVLRFSNYDVLHHFEAVCTQIDLHIRQTAT